MRVEGRDLTGLTRADRLWLRRRVQMIFQDPLSSLSPRFTVRRLLAEPIVIHGMDKAERWPKGLELMPGSALPKRSSRNTRTRSAAARRGASPSRGRWSPSRQS